MNLKKTSFGVTLVGALVFGLPAGGVILDLELSLHRRPVEDPPSPKSHA